MKVLVTGAAGFIGFHVSRALLDRGDKVVGIDNLNDYYDVRLKRARLDLLREQKGFSFHALSIADREAIGKLGHEHNDCEAIVHLAAQAGVRYSLINPYAYVESNLMGHVVMVEMARQLPKIKHFVYASSSSVYGGNKDIPFHVTDAVDHPVSLYAATKRADELMSFTYAHLYGLPCTGLRFFTVYGPWGRPDMAAYLFTKHIVKGEAITVFNNGNMKRDFTYIDDIVAGVVAAIDRPAVGKPPACLYNLGNSRAENLMDFIDVLQRALGRKAQIKFEPLQPGDVPETYADISESQRDLGFQPRISIEEGLPRFVAWYKEYHQQ